MPSAFREAEFERRLRAIETRCSKLETWQRDVRDELDELTERCDGFDKLSKRYVPLVDGMVESDKIAAGVAAALQARGTARWTTRERAVALVVAFSAIAGFVLELVRVAT